MIVLGLIALGGLGFGWNASSKLDTTQQSVASQLKAEQQSVQQDVSALRSGWRRMKRTTRICRAI